MSGSSRSAYLSALANDLVSLPTSRWLMMQPWCLWMNSIGSSTVMMWPLRSRLILSIIAARVVDLPEPVGPVTSTSPRGFSAIFAIEPGRPSCSKVLIANGICRTTIDTHPRCLKHVAAEAGEVLDAEREVELVLELETLLLLLGQNRVRELKRVLWRQLTARADELVMSPSMRSFGRSPATMCRSEALRETISSSSAAKVDPRGLVGGPAGDRRVYER